MKGDDSLVSRKTRSDDYYDPRNFIEDDFAVLAQNPFEANTYVERGFSKKTQILRVHPLFCVEPNAQWTLYPTDIGELGFTFQKIDDKE